MFLDWRVGESHTRGASGPHHPKTHGASVEELTSDVASYRADLQAGGGLIPGAVQTYAHTAGQFVRWLDGRFQPGARARGAAGSPPIARRERASRATPDLAWSWEGRVQSAVVVWLEADGWTVHKQADTRAGTHGVDIEARRGTQRLSVEVKGYPQATYARGERAGEPKKWHVGAQARTYFGTGLHAAIILRDRDSSTQGALALPDVPTYRSLLGQVRLALRDLGLRVFLVAEDGSVSELRT
jgi:hypothetical protein